MQLFINFLSIQGWFKANTNFSSARHIRYTNFPTFFRWNKTDRKWDPRAKYRIKVSHPTRYDFTLHDVQHVVGRMYNISPKEGERYFLRTLQLHKAGMDYFKSLRIVDGVLYSTHREACCALGLLADDAEWMWCLQESYASSSEALTTVFATILSFFDPSNPVQLWNKNKSNFIENIRKQYKNVAQAQSILVEDEVAEILALIEARNTLLEINPRFNLDQFGLKRPSDDLIYLPESVLKVKEDTEDLRSLVSNAVGSFNEQQKRVFNSIIEEILRGASVDHSYAPITRQPKFTSRKCWAFFLDAPGGKSKIFTIRAIQVLLKLRTRTTIAVATSPVAASLLDEGRTAHSCYSDSVLHIPLESALAAKIRDADLIIWDEIVMCIRYCIEAVDRTLRAIMKNPSVPFGGKCILFSGDIRQVLPVVPRGSRGMVVHLCLKSSPISKISSYFILVRICGFDH